MRIEIERNIRETFDKVKKLYSFARELRSIWKHPRANNTADLIIERDGEILLIKRRFDPFAGMYAIPGGFLEVNKEDIEDAAVREAFEETNLVIDREDIKLVGVYSDPGRDPRGHIISTAFYTNKFEGTPRAKDDAIELGFFKWDDLPDLAFDHNKIEIDAWEKYGNRTAEN